MHFATIDGVTLHYWFRPGMGIPVVFLNSLGTDFRIWDTVIDRLPSDMPVVCIDKRGHGLSDCGPITMDLLIGDVVALLAQLDLPPALICGVSVGGMIAQGLSSRHPDLVRGLLLCCTGAKIGDAESWNARIDAVRDNGITSLSGSILERWFSSEFRTKKTAELSGYRNMLERTPSDGYTGACAAIRDTDFTSESAAIKVPTICVAGSDDLATPPALVEELSTLIPEASYRSIEGCGHLPCIEVPEIVAETIRDLRERTV